MKDLISAKKLLKLNGDLDLVILDVRGSKTAEAQYLEGHLAGAIFVDLNKDLAAIPANAADGGRHPLPSPLDFVQQLGKWGIHRKTRVVVYDDMGGANAAARLWWMLKSIGHSRVQVLNGGFQAAVAFGFPISTGVEEAKSTSSYPESTWRLPITTLSEVEKQASDSNFAVIDVRDTYRYRGESEPIDLIAGHIPGAINLPYSMNLDENGLFHAPEKLREMYQPLFEEKGLSKITVHCGSGVTACHTLLAMSAAGFQIPSLYVGSWSEWSRNDKPIGTC
jgi:thiosulfate/3-mercaptopyruvate sulfurtransferase